MQRVDISIKINWHDIWIGLYWNETDNALHIYVCIIPCIPVHVSLTKVY